MKLDLENGWFYSITESPLCKDENKYLLRIFYRKELIRELNSGQRPSENEIHKYFKR